MLNHRIIAAIGAHTVACQALTERNAAVGIEEASHLRIISKLRGRCRSSAAVTEKVKKRKPGAFARSLRCIFQRLEMIATVGLLEINCFLFQCS